MAVFKCKMCGGDLDITEGMTVCECEYCGTQQTVPRLDDEKKINLFSRANRLRAACEFDKAAGVYESIVAEFPEEAEAYWGLILCRYGIEYVDDPVTAKKIPTCHRSSFTSIFEDSDLDMVMENSDAVSRRVYREEAKAIEELRKGIIEVSAKEEPYDIFICYKETDGNGDRTIDSVIAQDIYTALTEKGYRVFFSRISLEDKLGTEYEPYIFAALNSARVMLAVGTDYEYYNAVWVKNEWSRFLMLMASDKKRALIPCYKNLDAYDMPKEFQRLQSQDMGKVGAMQDLLRGIEKILPKTEVKPQPAAAAQTNTNADRTNTDALLRRIQLFLEDKEWNDAREYCNKALDIDPECARAYFYMTMAELHICNKADLEKYENADSFSENKNYRKALRFADDGYRAELEQINKQIIYNSAAKRMSDAATAKLQERSAAYAKAKKYFASIAGFKDADQKAAEVERLYNEESEKQEAERRAREEKKAVEIKKVIERLAQIREKLPAGTIAVGGYHTVGLRKDGTVVAVGDNEYGQCNVNGWRDIVAVSAGFNYTVGLKRDGTVLAVGTNDHGGCIISEWCDIVAISAGFNYTAGLKDDGTVVKTKDHGGVQEWRDIVAVSSGAYHTAGLRRDGTVVSTENTYHDQGNVREWCDIVAVSAGDRHTIGLKSNGMVVSVGDNEYGQCNVSGWRDIVAVAAGFAHTVGLRSNGTVIAAGSNGAGECNVSKWRNIVAIMAGSLVTIGLKNDGTVVFAGANNKAQGNVGTWRNIETRSLDAIKKDIKEANPKYKAELARLEKQLQEPMAIYEANKGKLFGEGARLKKAAKAEIDRLNEQIAMIKSRIR